MTDPRTTLDERQSLAEFVSPYVAETDAMELAHALMEAGYHRDLDPLRLALQDEAVIRRLANVKTPGGVQRVLDSLEAVDGVH